MKGDVTITPKEAMKVQFVKIIGLLILMINFSGIKSQSLIIIDHIGEQDRPIESFYISSEQQKSQFIKTLMKIHLKNGTRSRTAYGSFVVPLEEMNKITSFFLGNLNDSLCTEECKKFGSFKIRLFESGTLQNIYYLYPLESSLVFFQSLRDILSEKSSTDLKLHIANLLKRLDY